MNLSTMNNLRRQKKNASIMFSYMFIVFYNIYFGFNLLSKQFANEKTKNDYDNLIYFIK